MLACALWGLSFPLAKALSQRALLEDPGLSTWFVAAFVVGGRFLAAALLSVALSPLVPSRSELVQGAGLGAFTAAGMLLQMDGLNFTAASTSAFLTQGYIVALPLAAMALERRLPSVRVVIAVVVVVIGLWILSGFDARRLELGRGEAETLIAAGFFTLQIVWLGRRAFAGNRTGPVTAVMFASAALLLLPFSALSARSADDYAAVLSGGPALAVFGALTLACTFGAFWLMNRFQPRLSPSEAGVIYGAEPLFASVFALGLPTLLSAYLRVDYANEGLTRDLLVGGGLVTLANVLLQVTSSQPKVVRSADA